MGASVLAPVELELTGRTSLLVRKTRSTQRYASGVPHQSLGSRERTPRSGTTSSLTPTGLNKTARPPRYALGAVQSTRRQATTPNRCPYPAGITASSRRSAQRHLRATPPIHSTTPDGNAVKHLFPAFDEVLAPGRKPSGPSSFPKPHRPLSRACHGSPSPSPSGWQRSRNESKSWASK